ncbi:hypothetical protein K491DRAFT_6653 [Lophiostoma macrostomum CBS 122681]|uniref:Uncharacterized protein n=1 Tax=Lophiostoma macrostomum CBS 122681 TaxID=1314788 RepID=A0A6A6TS51_9PLEO|nr:hypothetical protein K491DRAFT_6653 [Lophiostoma macrostomum CBS 122681]
MSNTSHPRYDQSKPWTPVYESFAPDIASCGCHCSYGPQHICSIAPGHRTYRVPNFPTPDAFSSAGIISSNTVPSTNPPFLTARMKKDAEEHSRLHLFTRAGRLAEQQKLADLHSLSQRVPDPAPVYQQMNIQFLSLQREPLPTHAPGFTTPLIDDKTLPPPDPYTTSRFPSDAAESSYLESLECQIAVLKSQRLHIEHQRESRTSTPNPLSTTWYLSLTYTLLMATTLALSSHTPSNGTTYLLGALLALLLRLRTKADTTHAPPLAILTGVLCWTLPSGKTPYVLGVLLTWLIGDEVPGSEIARFKRESYTGLLSLAVYMIGFIQGVDGNSIPHLIADEAFVYWVPFALVAVLGVPHVYARFPGKPSVVGWAERRMEAVERAVDHWQALGRMVRFVLGSWVRENGEFLAGSCCKWDSVRAMRWRGRVGSMAGDAWFWVKVAVVVGALNWGHVRWMEWSDMVEPVVLRMSGLGDRVGVVRIGA